MSDRPGTTRLPEGTRCGIHGDPTHTGRCASCDAHGWASVKGGKWHKTVAARPSWYPASNVEATLCGLTIHPVNFTWDGEAPTSLTSYLCKHCTREDAP